MTNGLLIHVNTFVNVCSELQNRIANSRIFSNKYMKTQIMNLIFLHFFSNKYMKTQIMNLIFLEIVSQDELLQVIKCCKNLSLG